MRNIMKEKSLLSNNQIYKSEIAKIMQKVSLQEAPTPILSVFQDQRRIGGMNTRSNSDIFIPSIGKSKCMQALNFSGPKIWNCLPEYVKKEPNNVSLSVNDSQLIPYEAFSKSIKSFALSDIDFI